MTIPFKLAGIYDEDVTVYRRGEDQAVVLLGKSALVLRPWRWYDVSYRDECPPVPETIETALIGWTRAIPTHHGGSTLGALLVWASRRTPIEAQFAPDEEYMFNAGRALMDAQPCMGEVFNRRLVRDVLQTFVEDGAVHTRGVALALLRHNSGSGSRGKPGPLLAIRSEHTECFVMGLKDDVDAGTDHMPGDWTKEIYEGQAQR